MTLTANLSIACALLAVQSGIVHGVPVRYRMCMSHAIILLLLYYICPASSLELDGRT